MDTDRDKRLRELIARAGLQKPPDKAAKAVPAPPPPQPNIIVPTTPAKPPLFTREQAEMAFTVCFAIAGYNMSIAWRVSFWLLTGGLLTHLIAFGEGVRARFSVEKRWLAVVVFPLAVCACFVVRIHQEWIHEHAIAASGMLEPEDRSLSSNSDDSSPPIMDGGDSDNGLRDTAPGGTMLNMDNDQITLKRVNGKVLFSTTVRDQSGKTVVQVADNHWYVAPDRGISWDHNYDDNALEVLDSQRKVVIQVRLDRDGVRLQGYWFGGRNIFEGGRLDPVFGIKPLFKYPSELYWSQRSGDYGF